MSTWGYVFDLTYDENGDLVAAQFNRLMSVMFELQSLILTTVLLLVYRQQLKRVDAAKPIGYIHNSQWLKQYMVPYYIYFLLVAMDTFFAQTLIQFVVFCMFYSH